MDKMAMGVCLSLRKNSLSLFLSVSLSISAATSFPRRDDFCSISFGSSLKELDAFERIGCFSGMCNTVHALSTPIASCGPIAV